MIRNGLSVVRRRANNEVGLEFRRLSSLTFGARMWPFCLCKCWYGLLFSVLEAYPIIVRGRWYPSRASSTPTIFPTSYESLCSPVPTYSKCVSPWALHFVKFSHWSWITNEQHHQFTLTFGRTNRHHVVFCYSMKTGIPKLSDSGLVDVVLGGEGMTEIQW